VPTKAWPAVFFMESSISKYQFIFTWRSNVNYKLQKVLKQYVGV